MGLSARNQGPRRKKPGQRVDSRKPEGFLNKISKRKGIERSRPSDHRPTNEIRTAGERVSGRERALTSGPRWSTARGKGGLTGRAQR
jgi:hypothetical protein